MNENIKIELSKDNTLSLLGLLSIIKIDFQKSENNDVINVITELQQEISKQMNCQIKE